MLLVWSLQTHIEWTETSGNHSMFQNMHTHYTDHRTARGHTHGYLEKRALRAACSIPSD